MPDLVIVAVTVRGFQLVDHGRQVVEATVLSARQRHSLSLEKPSDVAALQGTQLLSSSAVAVEQQMISDAELCSNEEVAVDVDVISVNWRSPNALCQDILVSADQN